MRKLMAAVALTALTVLGAQAQAYPSRQITLIVPFAPVGSTDVASAAQQTPEGLAKFQQAELEKWWPIIKSSGAKPE